VSGQTGFRSGAVNSRHASDDVTGGVGTLTRLFAPPKSPNDEEASDKTHEQAHHELANFGWGSGHMAHGLKCGFASDQCASQPKQSCGAGHLGNSSIYFTSDCCRSWE
jgi:hypothetical protein